MSRSPAFAVVLEGGLVQCVIVQDWPDATPLPRIAIVDYDTEGASDDEITCFPVADETTEAVCRIEVPLVYGAPAVHLSPNAVLAALDEADHANH